MARMTDAPGGQLDRPLVTPAERVSLERAAPDALSTVVVDSRYAPVSRIGEGGMGEVWLARDTVIGRDVAIKSVHRAREGHLTARARFLREARVQGQLAHPSIVPVHDLGMGPDRRLYFTMQHVRGRPLDEAAREGMSRRAALTAMSRLCLAVDYAHVHGVVHRDIKPSNLMIGDYGEVYLLDWGLAKIVGQDDLEPPASPRSGEDRDDSATTVGAVLGTPGYMAPEQVRGETVDERTDVYALGACLFELLARVPLHQGASMENILQSTMQGANARISERVPDLDVAPELEAICMRATRSDPAYRFPTARAMHEAIERFLEGDRDLERRRQKSADHARAAARFAEDAIARSDDEARVEAMREIGRALALDPDNAPAMQSLVQLLTHPPPRPPLQVEAQLRADMEQRSDSARRYSAIAFASALLPVFAIVWMGVRDWRWVGGALACCPLAMGSSLIPRRWGLRVAPALVVTFSLVGLLCVSRVAGAFVLVPALAFGLSVGLALFPNTVPLATSIATSFVAVLAPLVLEWAGVLPASYEFAGDRLCVRAQAVSFPEAPTIAYFLATSLMPVVVVSIYLARIRDRLVDAERRLSVQAWQLGNIVPTAVSHVRTVR
jgi:serine/threonine protein kinase